MLLEGSSNFKSHYTSNEGCETLKQQWMSVLTTQHHIPWADLVPPDWFSCCLNFGGYFGRNDTG